MQLTMTATLKRHPTAHLPQAGCVCAAPNRVTAPTCSCDWRMPVPPSGSCTQARAVGRPAASIAFIIVIVSRAPAVVRIDGVAPGGRRRP